MLSKGDDYDKWGIEIRCSFRDGESLQVLTAHRQSGGVRSSPLCIFSEVIQLTSHVDRSVLSLPLCT